MLPLIDNIRLEEIKKQLPTEKEIQRRIELAEEEFNETDINPPAELGRLADASGDKQSTRIKTPVV